MWLATNLIQIFPFPSFYPTGQPGVQTAMENPMTSIPLWAHLALAGEGCSRQCFPLQHPSLPHQGLGWQAPALWFDFPGLGKHRTS